MGYIIKLRQIHMLSKVVQSACKGVGNDMFKNFEMSETMAKHVKMATER